MNEDENRDVCPDCGEILPDPALIADAAKRHMILPAHEEIHMCPRPRLLLDRTS